MRVYISGPITGYANGNKASFDMLESALNSSGHEAVNPQALPHYHDKSWNSYMREDICALMTCDAVFVLDGWELSRGARIEVELAISLGMPVVSDLRRLI